MSSPNYIAGGDITPSRFVTISGSNTVTQADAASDKIAGISQEWSKNAPIPGASSLAAESGDPVMVYGNTDAAFLTATSSGWTAGDRLTSNATGKGVTASGTDQYGAIALTTVTAEGLGRVQVLLGKNP
jgi:hypothetical protein